MRREEQLRHQDEEQISKIRFVGFDLDGTLLQEPVRSFPEVFTDKTTRLFGLQPESTIQFAQSTMGASTVHQLQNIPASIGLPSHHVLRIISSDLRTFIANAIDAEFFDQEVELFPEVVQALTQLRQQGANLFISSSRPTTNIQKVLLHHPELAGLIDFAIGTDPNDPTQKKGEGHFRKAAEHFDIPFDDFIQQAAFVGDTPSDMKAGTSIGVITIGRTSTNEDTVLTQAGADNTINDFSNLPDLLSAVNNQRQKEHQEAFLTSAPLESILPTKDISAVALPHLNERLLSFSFEPNVQKPYTFSEIYEMELEGQQQLLARIYLKAAHTNDGQSFIPTLVIGTKNAVDKSTKRDKKSVLDIDVGIIEFPDEPNFSITLGELRQIPGIEQVLSQPNLSAVLRKSSLRFTDQHSVQTANGRSILVRVFRNCLDMTSENFTAFILSTDKQPLFDSFHAMRITNRHNST